MDWSFAVLVTCRTFPAITGFQTIRHNRSNLMKQAVRFELSVLYCAICRDLSKNEIVEIAPNAFEGLNSLTSL